MTGLQRSGVQLQGPLRRCPSSIAAAWGLPATCAQPPGCVPPRQPDSTAGLVGCNPLLGRRFAAIAMPAVDVRALPIRCQTAKTQDPTRTTSVRTASKALFARHPSCELRRWPAFHKPVWTESRLCTFASPRRRSSRVREATTAAGRDQRPHRGIRPRQRPPTKERCRRPVRRRG